MLLPMALAIGVDPIHFGIIVVTKLSIGTFTPPFGIGFYITCAIGGADPDQAIRHIWVYLGVLLLGVVVVASVPWLSIGFL